MPPTNIQEAYKYRYTTIETPFENKISYYLRDRRKQTRFETIFLENKTN